MPAVSRTRSTRRTIVATLLILPLWGGSAFAAPEFNYAEALQKTLFFLEAQQSGELSPNNRVAWRGDACLTDGKDIGKDLAGGWFDAGDHWTANLTMGFTATTLAWSAIEKPDGWLETGQMDELLESLLHVNRYFLKCVLNPDVKDPAKNLEVAIGCGGREGVPDPSVHAIWAPAEVAHLMTNRPTFVLNKDVPGADIPGAMAASMASTAMLLRQHGNVLKGKAGYGKFDTTTTADLLLDRAEKLTLFAHAHLGLDKELRNKALRSDGEIVEIGYRASPSPQVLAAASWLARATGDEAVRAQWIAMAEEVYDGEYSAEHFTDFWQDFGWANLGRIGAYNMMRLQPDVEKYHHELQLYAANFINYKQTGGGLRLREWHAHEWGSLRHANNAAVIALYYSDHIEKSPPLSGNTWWKGEKTGAQLKEEFRETALAQVNYALGANPYGRSYLVGFGREPFNNPHHRGAFGSWAGFHHFIDGKPERRDDSRHILYGALIAGPDHNDVFLNDDRRRPWMPIPGTEDHGHFYIFGNRDKPVQKDGYVWDDKDLPYQHVMDAKFNEVALDYNAGFMGSLAWLCADGRSAGEPIPDDQFPPKVERDESLDLWSTDREFFVSGKRLAGSAEGIELELTLWNRSRWPARVTGGLSFRYHFTHKGDVTATLSDGGAAKVEVSEDTHGRRYAEITWPGEIIHPGNHETNSRNTRLKLTAADWKSDDDWSTENLGDETRILPHIPVFLGKEHLGGDLPRVPPASGPTSTPPPKSPNSSGSSHSMGGHPRTERRDSPDIRPLPETNHCRPTPSVQSPPHRTRRISRPQGSVISAMAAHPES